MDTDNLPKLIRSSEEPLYLQLYRILLEQILLKNIDTAEKLPGMKQLAAYFNVSTITVNQALDKLIEDGYCYRRPKKGTFIGPGGSKGNEQNGTIILYNVHERAEYDLVAMPFYTHLRQNSEMHEQINLLIISGKQAEKQLAIQMKLQENILGVVLIGVLEFSSVLRLVRNYPQHNFVLLNYQYTDFERLAPSNLRGVFHDEFSGGYLAASYLIAEGHRRIGVLHYGVNDENYLLRLQGFRQAHKDHGIPLAESLICNTDYFSVLPEERGHKGMTLLLEREPRLDAVFCVNDILATGAMHFLKLNSKDEKIRIIGYDNHLPELHIANHFSTVEINSAAMSAAAIRMLLHPADYPCKQLFVAPRLIHF